MGSGHKTVTVLFVSKQSIICGFCLMFIFYCRIVPNLEEDDSPTSKSDASDGNEVNDLKSLQSMQSPKFIQNTTGSKVLDSLKCLQTNPEDDEIGDGLRTIATVSHGVVANTNDFSQKNITDRTHPLPLFTTGKVERRRRKLPEIPKDKKCKPFVNLSQSKSH